VTPHRAVLGLVAACLCAGSSEARTFKDVFRGTRPTPSPTVALGEALGDTVARSLPITSASPGLTFHYDPSSGAFERDTDLLGLAKRPPPSRTARMDDASRRAPLPERCRLEVGYA
jgi:hypothetical protein